MIRKIQVLIYSVVLFLAVEVNGQAVGDETAPAAEPSAATATASAKIKAEKKSKKKKKKIPQAKGQTKGKTPQEAKKKARVQAIKEAVIKAKVEAKIKAEAAAEARAAAQDPEEEENVVETTFIESNIMISEFFDGIAEGIDLFLAGQRLTRRENETAVKVSNYTYVVDKLPTTNATSVGVNLRLPNFETFWSLKFTSYDETQERGVRRSQLRQSPRAQNYGASVGVFQKLGDVRASFEPRVQFADPLSISHSLIFESLAEMPGYTVNPKLEFFANADQGTGIFTALNFHYNLTKIYSLTLVNEGEYEDKLHLFTVTNGLALGQLLSRRSSVSYGFFLVSKSQPNYHLSGYNLSVSFSKLIYKKILDWSFTPQMNFEEITNFRGTPGLTITINLNF